MKMEPIPEGWEGGAHMPMEDFMQCVKSAFFIDYDGHGVWATGDQMSDQTVAPSDITEKGVAPPDWATHVVWFNR